jgi:hypothetical protein
VNPGGEPERDDTGLPPVDIEIPDDARELDRDVQAYFRELRAERRRLRRHRLHGGLTRDGVILPLLACCLVLALITGTLLTVFTATSDQSLVPPPTSGTNTGRSSPPSTSPSSSSSASAPAGRTPAGAPTGSSLTRATVRLSDARLIVNDQPYFLRGMFGILLVLIPPRCACTMAVTRLAGIGVSAGRGAILVGTRSSIGEAQRYQARLTRLSPGIASNVGVTLDSQGALHDAVPTAGLTAVVISVPRTASGAQSVAYARNVTSSDLSSSSSPLSVALVSALKG